jgi:hypothetical protein
MSVTFRIISRGNGGDLRNLRLRLRAVVPASCTTGLDLLPRKRTTDSGSEVHSTPDGAEVHSDNSEFGEGVNGDEAVGGNAGAGNEVRGAKVRTDEASDSASPRTQVTKH